MEIPKGKYPGLDDFTTNLFHACWITIKQYVWALLEDSHTFSNVLLALDATFLAPIPKQYMA
jgi:hypothetical protein